jgi:hypothetical protein
VVERKVERQKKAEEKKATLTARIARKAAVRLARAATHRPKAPNHHLHKKRKGKKNQLQKPRQAQDDGNAIVVNSRLSLPEADVSSSGKLIKPSKKLRQ